MIATQVARIVADFTVFLNSTSEEFLNLDDSVQMMELLQTRVEEFDKPFLRELVDAFAVIAPEYPELVQHIVRDVPYDLELEETLAEDDPVRLAELEAIRDERLDRDIEETRDLDPWRDVGLDHLRRRPRSS